MSGLSEEQRADFMRHAMERFTISRNGINKHSRRCAECGVALPWETWEEALRLHLLDIAEDYAIRAANEALTEAADAIEAGVLPTHPNSGYRDGFSRAADIVRASTTA